MSDVSSTRKLVSASALMASGTMISRVLGVVRVAMLAFILGVGTRQVDMFELANSVPNSIYILFAGGALNTVLVPQIVRAIRNDPDGGEAYTNRIMTAFMLIITAVTVVVTAGASVVTAIYSSSAWRSEELESQYASMVALAYLTLPQIFFYGAFFLLGQVLNARDKFGPMMWAPIANNVVSILVLALYLVIWGNQQDHSAAFTTGQIWLLGAGSTLGIVVQTAVLIPYVRKVGFRIRPRFDLRGTGLGKTFRLAAWTIGFVAANQLALIVVQRLATSATATGHGAGLYAYNQAHLLWILPHSLITVSLATAMLPNASRLAAAGDTAGVVAEFTRTVRLALIVIVPATAVFIALAGPIAGILFGHGSASGDASFIAWALMGFAIGLIPFTVQFLCLRTYYALEDTRTPFLLQLVIAGLNTVGATVLVRLVADPTWVAACLAVAYSLAYLIGVNVTWHALQRRLPGLDGGALLLHLLRLLLGSAAGGVAAYFLASWITDGLGASLWTNLLTSAVGGLVVLGAFLGVGRLLKVRELADLRQLLRGRLGRRGPKADGPGRSGAELAEASLGQSLGDAGPPTVELPIIADLPVIRGDDLVDGPVTVVRNRPPISEHTFDAPSPVVAKPAVDDETSSTTEEPSDAEASDDDVADGWDDDDTAAVWPSTAGEESTGAMALDDIFRPEPAHDVDIATVGALLNTRYELRELLARRHGSETWRAHDQVLSRDVVVHVVAPGDPRISQLLLAARKGAVATDSRFLRVLDADEVTDPGQGIGAFVVAEYAPGRTLTDLLQDGPLSAIEAAHIVRELADALVGVHSQGLFHEQITPDSVILTTAGAVRLIGFGVESTLAGEGDGGGWTAREHADVIGLGKLLYACLVRHWPGEAGFGMPAAPIVAGETAPAHTVSAGISPALDRVCAATLTTRGSVSERRISTAASLVGALTEVLGTAEASADLEERVRSQLGPAPRPPARLPEPPVLPTTQLPTRPATPPVASLPSPNREQQPRRALLLLSILAALTLVISLIIVGLNSARDAAAPQGSETPTTGTSGSPSGTAAPEPLRILAVDDFDPEADGGSDDENPGLVGNVIDGDPDTSWETVRYLKRPDMGGQKPGVGVIVDLGEERLVTSATVTLNGAGPTAVELRVPQGEPSYKTVQEWTIVGADAEASGAATIPLTTPTTTRYLLVYVTSLPPVEGGFQASIAEITLA
ncbi:murein biosynthesis integral membrane protein MurJ [Tessaracoccus defluvii]|uniref:Murein biosynthesis integral membrane protein MurJ n=1 Tax=Tessaracoccus defluvii TaxID=1285901 RepID=A0A7H0H3W4_9ACTN|nr:murein biosynthesis integral membrane protein MurJ [Tessaracoccus defluvii]QNP55230.1 murein biosynthesis integral membrane protein MurJ [Tessaracoccus defluvii]